MPMLEKRRSKRSKMVLSVKVLTGKATHLVHTVDITPTGARVGSLRTKLEPGTAVCLQRGSKKAQFRISWVRQLGPNELQVGLQSLELLDNFWGVDLSDQQGDASKDAKALMSLLAGRP
jgi:hypothetical protein